MPVETVPDYKNKSQTLFGVAIICGGFVLETAQLTRGHPNPPTLAVLAVLAAVFIWSAVTGVVYHRRYKAQTSR